MGLEGESIVVRGEMRTEAELSKGTSQQEAEREQEQGKATNSDACPQWPTSSTKALPPEGLLTALNSAKGWEPRVEVHKSRGHDSHLNQNAKILNRYLLLD